MPEASVSIFDSVHLNNTSTDDDSSDSTDNSEIDSSSEYCPTPLKKARVSPVDLEAVYFYAKLHNCSNLLTK